MVLQQAYLRATYIIKNESVCGSLAHGILFVFNLFIIISKYTVTVFRRTRRGHQISWMRCEPPCGCWELNSGPSEEHSVLLTAEPSFQP